MDKRKIAERLKLLAQNTQHRTKAAQLRDVMGDVEEALSKGVPRKVIVSELAQSGLEMSLATFDSILLRERRKRAGRKASGKRRISEPFLPSTAQAETQEPDEPATGPSGPAALDRIINSTPDLAQYARMAKQTKRRQNT